MYFLIILCKFAKILKMNIVEEIWKDIPEYEGLYQASNLGRIRSLNYWDRGYAKVLKEIRSSTNPYLRVNLYKNKKAHTQTHTHKLHTHKNKLRANNKIRFKRVGGGFKKSHKNLIGRYYLKN